MQPFGQSADELVFLVDHGRLLSSPFGAGRSDANVWARFRFQSRVSLSTVHFSFTEAQTPAEVTFH